MSSTKDCLALFCLALVVADVRASTSCPRGMRRNNSRCYVPVDTKLTFDEAHEYCSDNFEPGGSLVTVTGSNENAFLTSFVEGPIWLGAFSQASDYNGPFIWRETLNRSEKTCRPSFVFSYWAPGEPRRGPPGYVKDCVMMDGDGRWRTAGCQETQQFVCKIAKLDWWT